MTLVPWFFGVDRSGDRRRLTLGQSRCNGPTICWSIVQIVLYWLLLRWLVANLASNGQPLGLSFSGSVWAYLGWNILFVISIITIIGWAWVYRRAGALDLPQHPGHAAAGRLQGHGSGDISGAGSWSPSAARFIIPIPWVYRWMMRWQLSQTELVERRADAIA